MNRPPKRVRKIQFPGTGKLREGNCASQFPGALKGAPGKLLETG